MLGNLCETSIIDPQTTVIQRGKLFESPYTALYNQLERQLEESFEMPVTDDITPFREMKDYYKSCMNIELIEQRELEPARKVLDAIGEWPVVVGHKWKSYLFNWESILAEAFKRGFSPKSLFNFAVRPDSTDSSKRILYVRV